MNLESNEVDKLSESRSVGGRAPQIQRRGTASRAEPLRRLESHRLAARKLAEIN